MFRHCLISLTLALSLIGCGEKLDASGRDDTVDFFDDTAPPITFDDTGDTAVGDSDGDSDGAADGDADGDSDADSDADDTGGPDLDVDADRDGVTIADGDCDDTDDSVFPGAAESCNGVDQDCDGVIDGPNPVDGNLWYTDSDTDGWGDPSDSVVACLRPESTTAFPGDCDDEDDRVSPGADELCDDLDNDCDGQIDGELSLDAIANFEDEDGDGYGNPEEVEYACFRLPDTVENDDDCNDDDSAVHPGAAETCDGRDEDCDGVIDEGHALMPFYPDGDMDGHGDAFSPVWSCSVPDGFVGVGGDCDDSDFLVHVSMPELCDAKDNDCDGEVDEDVEMLPLYDDLDGDGYGRGSSTATGCTVPSGKSIYRSDCDESDPEIYPGRLEECNGIDDNCDHIIDEGHPFYDYFLDSDADGYGAGTAARACEAPPDHVLDGTDCDDTDASVNPGIYADCEDGRDEDCDGEIDEGPDSTFYRDADGDGFGDADETTVDCAPPEGYVWYSTDCDDTDPDVNPEAYEVCGDDLDSDCDGWADDLDPDCDCPEHGIEEDDDIGTDVGDAVAEGLSSGSVDDIAGSCGSSGGEDTIILFRAEEDGCYTFDTESSSFDTVLRLYDACEGAELGCDDDGGGGVTSVLTEALFEGDEVLVVIDGYSSFSSGSWVLDIAFESAESSTETTGGFDFDIDDDIGSSVSAGSAAGYGSDYDGLCGSAGADDLVVRWEAPASGCYTFDTEGSSYDTVLRLYPGDSDEEPEETEVLDCGGGGGGGPLIPTGRELACDDDGGTGLTSSLSYTVEEGTVYYIIVDAYSAWSAPGSYILSISEC